MLCWGYIGMMENMMENTLGFRVWGLGFIKVWVEGSGRLREEDLNSGVQG